tara:strand:- start:833 stop:1468 length:636 start_codon:yes stop_codon:yes gene_type:complete
MANANRPSGFTPVQYLNGAPWNGQARLYSIDAAYGTALYVGDPVISGGGSDAFGVPNIALGATTGGLRGVLVGLFDSGSTTAVAGGVAVGNIGNPSLIYRPASHANVWYAMVADDPNIVFSVQEESNGTQLAAAEVGLNTISKSGTGNGYLSGWMIPSTTGATAATTATLQLKLLGLYQAPAGTNVFGAYAKWLVQINVHELGHGTGSLGV